MAALESEIADLQLRNLTASNHLKTLVASKEDKMVQVGRRAAPLGAAAGGAERGWRLAREL